MAKSRREKGQALPLLILALGLLLLGGLGLAIDGANLYAEGQMAQVAADAAATAGAMSLLQGVDVSGKTTYFSTAATGFTCSTTDAKLPCQYARLNGFGASADDTVFVDFPTCDASTPCGYQGTLSSTDSPNQIRVTITRSVNNSFIRMLGGPLSTPLKATSIAAIVTVQSPVPILITDPSNSNTLSMNGTTSITICGGPSRSIQVNSSNSQAYGGGGTVDLSKAGPADTSGDCTSGTGADFGVFGGDTTNPGAVSLGTTGHYISPSSPVQDPFANVSPPPVPSAAPSPIPGVKSTSNPNYGCQSTCTIYSPGLYASLQPGNDTVIFKPGVYYVQGNSGANFKQTVGGGANFSAMCVGCSPDPSTGTGMLIYDTGPAGSTTGSNPSGGFNIGTKAQIVFQGPTLTTTNNLGQVVPAAPYYGILFWEDRTADANSHILGQGNGCFSLVGTVYITNTLAIMQADPTHVQSVTYHGTPCSATINQGDIIVSDLTLKGNTSITMNLVPYGFMNIRQVALVAGGPHP